MKYPEEDIAVDLHSELTRRFGSTPTLVSIDGAGVHWHCTVRRDNSECSIACFTSPGPEYYTGFKRDSTEIATARIPSRDKTIDAVADWLDGSDLLDLHARYPFVDQTKRALSQLRDDVIASAPALLHSTQCELQHKMADIYYLRFKTDERSCEISYYGKNELPDAKFSWDGCQLFQYQPDDKPQLAWVLKRWLCDRSPPSAMRKEFAWLEIGELADYYENGKPIEGEFIRSWDFIEKFYQEDWCRFSDAVLAMIRAMRQAGYDRVLRAGQSLSSLALSRCRRHGLRAKQACIWFEFHAPVMNVHADFAGTALKKHPIEFSKEVQELVDALVEVAID